MALLLLALWGAEAFDDRKLVWLCRMIALLLLLVGLVPIISGHQSPHALVALPLVVLFWWWVRGLARSASDIEQP